MADVTLFVNSTDTALLSGGAASPVTASNTAGSTPVSGSFSSVLGGQLTPTDAAPVAGSSPPTPLTSQSAVTETGDAQPLTGKALPSTAVPEPLQPVEDAPSVLNTALLQPLLQGLPVSTGQGTGQAVDPSAATLDPSLPAQSRTAMLQMLGASLSAVQGEKPVDNAIRTSAGMNPAVNAQATMLAQQTAAQQAMQPLTTAPDSAQQASTAAVLPTMLGKPLSTAAQQALARASLNAGKPAVLRADSVASANANSTAVLSQLTGSANGMNQSMGVMSRMAVFNSAMNAASSGDPSIDLQQLSRAGNAATPLPTAGLTAAPEDASGFAATLSRLPGTASTSFMPSLSLATPVGHSAWANELSQRVTWLANNELREAQLQLHPRSLGSVEVRIAFGHEQQLNISFSAANPIARDALDANLPRLREMLEQQGLQLADASISHESREEREQRQQVGEGRVGDDDAGHNDEPGNELLAGNTIAATRLGEGMLDAYA